MSKNSNRKVEVFKRLNKLKLKAGIPLNEDIDGYINPADIKSAQARIDDKEQHYKKELEEILVFIDESWGDLKAADETNRKKHISKLHNYANNIKDLAETYNYDLMSHLGLSLRNFCEKIDPANKNHRVIVQAHIDVMWTAFDQNLKGEGGAIAQELKKVLEIAIRQNS